MSNKTTEQPIPDAIINELERVILPILKEEIEVVGRGRGTAVGFSLAAEKVSIAAYRHLHSLPPTPDCVETEDEKTQRKLAEWYLKQLRECQDELRQLKFVAPSPVGEAGDSIGFAEWTVLENWTLQSDKRWGKVINGTGVFHNSQELYAIFSNESPNPSRAGEISPVLRWIGEEVQSMGAIYNDTERLGQIRDSALVRAKALEEVQKRLTEIVPPKGLENKEDKEFYCINFGEIPCPSQCDGCKSEEIPPTPAPEASDYPHSEEVADLKAIIRTLESNCFELQGRLGKTKDFFTPTEQPAHVPDTKGGDSVSSILEHTAEVPEDIAGWIEGEIEDEWQYGNDENHNFQIGKRRDAARKMAIAMYRKMHPEIERGLATIVQRANEMIDQRKQIATLTQQNESIIASVEGWEGKYHRAEGDLQKVIDDLAAKGEEAGEYRKALEKVKSDPNKHPAVRLFIDSVLAKYPSTDTKPTT